MNLNRCQWLTTLVLALATAFAGAAMADAGYRSRPVKVMVGFPPGSATDVAARAVCEAMARRLGQPCVVENRTS